MTLVNEKKNRYEIQLMNQGDIPVDYALVPNTTSFGSRFEFTPNSGTLPVYGQENIIVRFSQNYFGSQSVLSDIPIKSIELNWINAAGRTAWDPK